MKIVVKCQLVTYFEEKDLDRKILQEEIDNGFVGEKENYKMFLEGNCCNEAIIDSIEWVEE